MIPRHKLLAASCTSIAVLLAPALAMGADSRADAARIVTAAMADSRGYERVAYLCDTFGPRIAPSPALDAAIQWAATEMKKDGLVNVSTPAVKVRSWIRGKESLELLAPRAAKLKVLGLGLSPGTPAEGITAAVIVVRSFEELDKLGREAVAGKIVLYDAPFESYSQSVPFRAYGSARAARLGAVAVLVRSVTPHSLSTPHTGGVFYKTGESKIPGAAVTVEDSAMMRRMQERGETIRVKLRMEARDGGDGMSANVIGEITGREKPEEIVVIGGHIDSWDIGQGAQDDGVGVVAAMEAARIIKNLGLTPRRTIRVVLWTDEEKGLSGGNAYKDWIGDSIRNHVAAIELDLGAERPIGFVTPVKDAKLEELRALMPLFDAVGPLKILEGKGDADTSPLEKAGVPVLGMRNVGEKYFHWHHTDADTVDKVDPKDLRMNIAAMAAMAYLLADMPWRLDQK